MNIYVCVKHVPDTAATIRIIDNARIDDGITFIMNPYDENAVEEAVRLKKKVGRAGVTAVTLGKKEAEATLRSALAMGADRGILVRTDGTVDAVLTARALHAAIQTDGNFDILFTGKESIDSEGFETMHRLGAAFDVPAVSNVVAFSLDQGMAKVECEMASGDRQILNVPLPCIIGAAKGLNEPTYPTLPAILKARKKEVVQIELSDLDIARPDSRIEIIELEPAIEKRHPQEIKGSPAAMAEQIVQILREEAKVI